MSLDARRPYRMRARRESMDATAARIAQAAFELHREIGPANTTISAVAERAGVERHTVYRHYPDLVSLFRACTAHAMRVTGPPDPDEWKSIPDRFERLATALRAMYGYYSANEQLLGNVLRDAQVMPEMAEVEAQFLDYAGRVWATVLEPWEERRAGPVAGSGEGAAEHAAIAGAGAPAAPGSGSGARALISTALEFSTWQAMTRRAGLSDDEAADTIVAAVRGLEAGAAAPSDTWPAAKRSARA